MPADKFFVKGDKVVLYKLERIRHLTPEALAKIEWKTRVAGVVIDFITSPKDRIQRVQVRWPLPDGRAHYQVWKPKYLALADSDGNVVETYSE